MRTASEIASACNVWFLSQNLLLSEGAFRDDENVGSPIKFFQKVFKTFCEQILKKRRCDTSSDWSATISQIANPCQIPCCIIKYSWVNKCDVTRLRHKYLWYVEILVTSSIIPYLKIMYPHMEPPTTPGPQAPHHLNPALARGAQFTGHRVTMGAPYHCGGRRKVPTVSQVLSSIQCICFQKTSVSNMGAPKSPNNVTSTFFNTTHLLPKDLCFEHGGAKLASCPWRHLASLHPCLRGFASK